MIYFAPHVHHGQQRKEYPLYAHDAHSCLISLIWETRIFPFDRANAYTAVLI